MSLSQNVLIKTLSMAINVMRRLNVRMVFCKKTAKIVLSFFNFDPAMVCNGMIKSISYQGFTN